MAVIPDEIPDNLPEEKKMPFDTAVTTRLQQASQNAIAAHPEIRSIVIAIDYRGGLAQSSIKKIVWTGDGPQGAVSAPDAVIGSIQVTTEALRHMLERVDLLQMTALQLLIESGKKTIENYNKTPEPDGTKP